MRYVILANMALAVFSATALSQEKILPYPVRHKDFANENLPDSYIVKFRGIDRSGKISVTIN